MSLKGNIGQNTGIISTGAGSHNTIVHNNSRFSENVKFHNECIGTENNFGCEADIAIKKIKGSTNLIQSQKDTLLDLIDEAKKADKAKDEGAKELCKKGFKMFIGGAGEIVKETLKTILPPLILAFFDSKK